VIQKDAQGKAISTQDNKYKPVYINANNISQWKSIQLQNKKLTLSDSHLKALTLGQLVANKLNASELFDQLNPPDIYA